MLRGSARMVRHALIMMFGTCASRVLGLVREILIAAFFGATRQLDAFYVAYTLANLSRQLLAEGALSAAFIPVFSRVLSREGRPRALHLARQALTVLLGAGVLVVLLGIWGSPVLVRLMAPGFEGDSFYTAVNLTRLLFPFLLLVSVGALAMGVLNSMDRFFVPAVAPALSNVVFIGVLLLFAGRGGDPGVLVWGVLLGGVSQLCLQWLWTLRLGMPLVPALPRRDDPELRRMLTLFLPYAAGLSLNQLMPVISKIFGSYLEPGAISVLNYADRVLQLPLGLFVIAISQAVLPLLSKIEPEDHLSFLGALQDAVRFGCFVVLPVMVGMLLLADPMVHLLFYRGAFSPWAWKATSGALACYALGLPGMACNTIVLRGLYARGYAKKAVMVTLTSVGTHLVCSLLLMRVLSFRGLALSASISFTAAAFVGYRLLRKEMSAEEPLFPLPWLARIGTGLCWLFAGVGGYGVLFPYPVTESFAHRGFWFGGVFILGVLLYAFSTRYVGTHEWQWIRQAVTRKGERHDRTE